MPVTISCSMVPAQAAQSATVGSPASPGPKTVSGLARVYRLVAEVDDDLVHRDPADDAAPAAAEHDLGPAGGGARQPVGVPERQQARGGVRRRGPGVAVADGACRRAPGGPPRPAR